VLNKIAMQYTIQLSFIYSKLKILLDTNTTQMQNKVYAIPVRLKLKPTIGKLSQRGR